MTTSGQGVPGPQQYTVSGDGVISTGSGPVTFTKSGQPGNDISAGLLVNLEKELTRIRAILESADSHVRSADRDDAIEGVDALAGDIPGLGQSADGRRKLRQRIKALVGVLTPVAGLIGGVAALESILQHL